MCLLSVMQIMATIDGRHGGQLTESWHNIVFFGCVLKTLLFQLCFKIIRWLPRGLILKIFGRSQKKESTLSGELVADMSKISWSGTRHFALMFYYDYFKSVRLGTPAIDVDFLDLNGSPCRLFDFCKTGRPLVLNFGSIS